MSRMIDADALWMDIIHAMDYCDDILEIIERQPTIEPERKKGKWIQTEEHIGGVCSNCGEVCQAVELGTDFPVRSIWNFCPNCGAYMGES